jgi:hypothetical protein
LWQSSQFDGNGANSPFKIASIVISDIQEYLQGKVSMSIKSNARTNARNIRRMKLGFSFGEACLLGRMIAQGKSDLEIKHRMPCFKFRDSGCECAPDIITEGGVKLEDIIKKAKNKGLLF